MPGRVKVAPRRDMKATNNNRFIPKATLAARPKARYITTINNNTKAIPTVTDFTPRAILSAPSDGPMVRSSTIYIGAAKAPALSNNANSEDSR